mgnify:CR=1 FL=1
MSDRCSEIEKKVEDFKDAYVKNNKEFLMLSFAVGELRDTIKEHMASTHEYKLKREDEDKQFKEQLQPMIVFFEGMNFTRKLVFWIIGGVTAMVGLAIGIKKLFE